MSFLILSRARVRRPDMKVLPGEVTQLRPDMKVLPGEVTQTKT